MYFECLFYFFTNKTDDLLFRLGGKNDYEVLEYQRDREYENKD